MRFSFFVYYFRFFVLAAAIIPIAIVVINSQTVAAAGFGVSPSKLEFVVEKGSEASRQLIIYNTGKEAAKFTARSSNPETAQVLPEKGTIRGEGTALVTVIARGIKRDKEGKSEEEIIINFNNPNSNADKGVSLSLGTAVPVRLQVLEGAHRSANVFVGMALSASIVLTGLAAHYASKRKAKKPATTAEFSSAYDLYMARR